MSIYATKHHKRPWYFFSGHLENPMELAENSTNIYLEMPKYGGHVGFTSQES